VGRCKALLMDEISTGLDSSTTYQIVRCMRNVAHLQDVSCFTDIIALCGRSRLLFCGLATVCGPACMQLHGSVMQCLYVVFKQATVLMSLLQPPPETYDLFDDIMLLSDGVLVLPATAVTSLDQLDNCM
jgi:hypothetical protein